MVHFLTFATVLSTACALTLPYGTSDAILKSRPIIRDVQRRGFLKRPYEEDTKPDVVEIGNGYPEKGTGSNVDDNEYKRLKTTTPSYDLASPMIRGSLPPEIYKNGVRIGNKEMVIYQGKDLHVLVKDGLIYAQTVGRTPTGEEKVSFPRLWTPFDPLHPTPYDAEREAAFYKLDSADQQRLRHEISVRLGTIQTPVSPKQAADSMKLNWLAADATTVDMDMLDITYEDNSGDVETPRADPQWGALPLVIPDEGDFFLEAQPDVSFGKGIPTWNQFSNHLFGLDKRQNLVDEIKTQGSGTGDAGENNSTADLTAEFQLYLDAYQTAQSNISNLLFPFFDTILNTTNNSLVYDTIWSVYSDLTGIGPHITGPFSYGKHCFDWIEDQYRNSTLNGTHSINNTNTTDPALQQMLATHHILLEVYDYAWTNGKAIANQTGLLSDMMKLSEYLTPTDPSIMSAEWTSPQEHFDDSYFTDYNKTMRKSSN